MYCEMGEIIQVRWLGDVFIVTDSDLITGSWWATEIPWLDGNNEPLSHYGHIVLLTIPNMYLT